MFPEFQSFIGEDRQAAQQAIVDLGRIEREKVMAIVHSIPSEWEVTSRALEALVGLIMGRATYVAETIEQRIWPQLYLDYGNHTPEEPES